jgi:D-alanine-D-alanine ligase
LKSLSSRGSAETSAARSASRSLKRLSVLVLVDEGALVPGRTQFVAGLSDRDVVSAVRRLVRHCAVAPFINVSSLLSAIAKSNANVVFNLTQHANGDRRKDGFICAILELEGIPYTGASPSGLTLCRDKVISKHIASRAGFRVPRHFVVDRRRVYIPPDAKYPLVVKPRYGDSSEGISQRSLVYSNKALLERIELLRRQLHWDIICEEFIEGREMAIGVLGDEIVRPREFIAGRRDKGYPRLASERFKYDLSYRRRWRLTTKFAHLRMNLLKNLRRCTLEAAAALEMRDYGRLDIKLTAGGEWVFLEANPNPGLSRKDTTWSGTWDSVNFDQMIAKIICWARARRISSGN